MTAAQVSDPSRVYDGPEAWMRLGVAMMLGTIGSIGMWAGIVVLPLMQGEFGIDRASASLPYTTTMIGFALGNAIVGRYVDRFGIMLPVMVASLALGLGFIGAAHAADVWTMAAFQLMVGVGTSATFGPLMADISHWFRRHRGIAVASVACGNYLAGALWPAPLQTFAASYGWRVSYVVVGILVVATILPLAVFLRRPPPKGSVVAAVIPGGAGGVTTSPFSAGTLTVLLSIAAVACCVAMSMPQVHIVAYCADLGYGVARGAEMLSLMVAGGVVSRLASGLLADRIGGIRTLLIGSVLQAIALLFYIPFDGLASLYIVSLVFGLAQGGIVPSYAIIVRELLPADQAGSRVGIVIMMSILGMALGGWMSGWIYDITGSYRAAFLNGIAWNVLNIAIMTMLLWRSSRSASVRVVAA